MSQQLEKKKLLRAVIREEYTRCVNELEQYLKDESSDWKHISASFLSVESMFKKLRLLDAEIFDSLLDEATDEELEHEDIISYEYDKRYFIVKVGVEFFRERSRELKTHRVRVQGSKNVVEAQPKSTNNLSDDVTSIRKFELPSFQDEKLEEKCDDAHYLYCEGDNDFNVVVGRGNCAGFEVLDQSTIGNRLSPVCGTLQNRKLEMDIAVSDEKSGGPIEVIIGADAEVTEEVSTNDLVTSHCGLDAVETFLGGTFMEEKSSLPPSKAPLVCLSYETKFNLTGWELSDETSEEMAVAPVLGFQWHGGSETLTISDEYLKGLSDRENLAIIVRSILSTTQRPTFVWNRIAEVRAKIAPDVWLRIPEEYNPADLPYRGCSPRQLLVSKCLECPAWFCRSSQDWPQSKLGFDEAQIKREQRERLVTTLLNSFSDFWILEGRRTAREAIVKLFEVMPAARSVVKGTEMSLRLLDMPYIEEPRVVWRFRTPSASWWGVFWRCPIDIVERILREFLDQQNLEPKTFLGTDLLPVSSWDQRREDFGQRDTSVAAISDSAGYRKSRAPVKRSIHVREPGSAGVIKSRVPDKLRGVVMSLP